MKLTRHKFTLMCLAVVASIGLSIAAHPLHAQQTPPQLPPTTRTPLPLVNSGGTQILDWTKINFQYFGGMHEAGSFKAPPQLVNGLGFDPSVTWSVGTPVSSVIRLGFVDQAFGLQMLSLDQIGAYTGVNVKALPLNAYGLLKWQSLGTLVQAVPSLKNLPVSQVPPIAALVRGYGGWGFGFGTTYNMTIGQLLMSRPMLAGLPLTPILTQYNIASIPGLSAAKIEGFRHWKAAFIADIPGLPLLVFARFPIQPQSTFTGYTSLPPQPKVDKPLSSSGLLGKGLLNNGLLVAALNPFRNLIAQANIGPFQAAAGAAILDLPLNYEGFVLTNVITGSDRVGFNFPCAQPLCGHVELGLPFQGARFISGTQQWVLGGHGLLGSLFGNVEPTGRPLVGNPNPEKEPFKLILNWADDTTGTALFGLAMHWCIHHTWPDPLPNPDCTPYIFQFPGIWLYPEKSVVFIGGPGSPVPLKF
ncbi:MAG: hypothetical protein MH252_12830 [Thermosynechococcaceae cyanobacterium MS004]|nr:hypothetical protein [Thermosynechococcaceae cyanobacterium MS004]